MRKRKVDTRIIIYALVYVLTILDIAAVLPLQIARLASSHSSYVVLRSNIVQYEQDKNLKETFINQENQVASDIETMRAKTVSFSDVSSISAYVSSQAKKNAVEILEIVPGETQSYQNTADGTFLSLPLSIEAKAGYHNIAQFINALEAGRYFLQVKELLIKEKTPYHRMHLVVSAIIQQEGS